VTLYLMPGSINCLCCPEISLCRNAPDVKDLHLPVKAEYFHAMRDGTKLFEYRLRTPFWSKRIAGRVYRNVVITLGYPKRGDPDRTLTVPWQGFEEQTITHPHFGPEPVEVFAIRIEGGR